MKSQGTRSEHTATSREDLSLEHQLCIVLYQAANKTARLYRTFLGPFDLTFSQYMALVALWDRGTSTVGSLCAALDLETSTLTPVLKRLESLGYVRRFRDRIDERRVYIALTDKGQSFRAEAVQIRCRILDAIKVPMTDVDDIRHKLQELNAAVDRATVAEQGEQASDRIDR